LDNVHVELRRRATRASKSRIVIGAIIGGNGYFCASSGIPAIWNSSRGNVHRRTLITLTAAAKKRSTSTTK